MNKSIFIVLITLFTSINYANTVTNNTIKLPKHFKILSTFSGDLDDSKSFHLIISKNKQNKKYTIHPYIFNGTAISKLNNLENKFQQSILSFHQKKDLLSLLISYSDHGVSYIQQININLLNKEIIENDPLNHKDFSASFREKNRSILIYKNKKRLVVRQFLSSEYRVSEYVFTGNKDEVKTYFKNQFINTVKTDEFVKNGSTANLKAYLKNNKIVFSKKNATNKTIEILEFPFDLKIIKSLKIIKHEFDERINTFDKFTSFINDDKSYQLILNKTKALVDIIDYKTNNSISTIEITPSFILKKNTNKLFEGLESFLKNVRKKKYIPTITVNKTTTDDLKIRLDYVDINYSYNYNWWFHHQHFMQFQQFHNQTINVGRSFGPSQPCEFIFEIGVTPKEKRFLEFVISKNGFISNNQLSDTFYKEIDKKKYIDILEDIKDITLESSCFLNNSFRYIGYSKELKHFVIQTNKIH